MSVPSLRLSPVVLALAALAGIALASSPARADRYSDAVAQAGRPAGDLRRDQIDHPAAVSLVSRACGHFHPAVLQLLCHAVQRRLVRHRPAGEIEIEASAHYLQRSPRIF